MVKLYHLGLTATFFLSACGVFSIAPRSEIVATDLRDQALTDDFRADGADPFSEQLDKVQGILEGHFFTMSDSSSVTNLTDLTVPIIPPRVLLTYVNGRFVQINDLCKIYFDGLFRISRNQRFARDELSLLTDLTTAVLGITGAAVQQLTLLSLGSAALQGTATNYEDVYLLTPNPEKIYKMVQDAQTAWLGAKTDDIGSITEYHQARDTVREYAKLCTPVEIRRLIDEAIDASNPRPSDPDRALLRGFGVQGIVRRLGAALGDDGFSTTQAVLLYIVLKQRDVGASNAQAKAAEDLLDAATLQRAKGDGRPEVDAVFLLIGPELKAAAISRLASLVTDEADGAVPASGATTVPMTAPPTTIVNN